MGVSMATEQNGAGNQGAAWALWQGSPRYRSRVMAGKGRGPFRAGAASASAHPADGMGWEMPEPLCWGCPRAGTLNSRPGPMACL